MEKEDSKAGGWIDVTVPVVSGMVHWPGDDPVKVERRQEIAKGDLVNMSTISMGAHTGTHMDAPLHFLRDGKSLDELPFEAIVGRARVVEISDPVSIEPDALVPLSIQEGERILFKTRNSTVDWHLEEFMEDYVHVSLDSAGFLVERKVQTIGIDYLSIGGYKADNPETHRRLLEAGIWLIEGLDLSRVEQGGYRMVCLPLRLHNTEGSPARVILKKT